MSSSRDSAVRFNRAKSEGSAAYDTLVYKRVSRREPPTDARRQTPAAAHRSSQTLRLRRVNKTASLPMTGKAFRSFDPAQVKVMAAGGLALGLAATFCVLSIGYESKKNELASRIAQKQAELQTLQNDYQGMMVEYDQRLNDTAIEEYAKKELGMQKRENFQLRWIEVGEQTEFENDDTQKKGFMEWLASYFE